MHFQTANLAFTKSLCLTHLGLRYKKIFDKWHHYELTEIVDKAVLKYVSSKKKPWKLNYVPYLSLIKKGFKKG